MNVLGLTIIGSILVFVIILTISLIYDANKEKRKFKKHVEELKIGNRYKMKDPFLRSDNPFKVESKFIVEITDIKLNYKDKLYVQYKQIEPEYKGEPFSDPFSNFIDVYELIK